MNLRLSSILVATALLLATIFSVNPLVRGADAQSRTVLTSAVTVYASLRALNAFLSTAQEVELGASFVASGSLQPLKILEPLDDTVEIVSELVLSVAMGAGIATLGVGPLTGIGCVLVILGACAWSLPQGRKIWRYGLALGLGLPLAMWGAGVLGEIVTNQVLTQHEALLAEIAGGLDPAASTAAQTTAQSGGTMTWLLNLAGSVSQSAQATGEAMARLNDYSEVARSLVERADELVQSYIQVIGVFVLRVLILPVLFFWLALSLTRA